MQCNAVKRAIKKSINQQLMKAAASNKTATLPPPLQNYVDQSPNRSGGFLDLVDRRRVAHLHAAEAETSSYSVTENARKAIVQTFHRQLRKYHDMRA